MISTPIVLFLGDGPQKTHINERIKYDIINNMIKPFTPTKIAFAKHSDEASS